MWNVTVIIQHDCTMLLEIFDELSYIIFNLSFSCWPFFSFSSLDSFPTSLEAAVNSYLQGTPKPLPSIANLCLFPVTPPHIVHAVTF